MMEGKNKSGFKFKFDERALTDWRFLLAVQKVQNGSDLEKVSGAVEMVEIILGKEGHKALVAHIANKSADGFVSVDAIMAEVNEIIASSNKAKN
jgi:hypothetical protein